MDPVTILLLIAIILLIVIIVLLIIYVINLFTVNKTKTEVCIDPNNNKNMILSDSLDNLSSQPKLIETIKNTVSEPTQSVTVTQPYLNDFVVPNPRLSLRDPFTIPYGESTQNAIFNNENILNYDLSKLNNPLVEPTRRVERYELPKYYFRNMIDLPTRGYPDNYTQLGILVAEGNNNWNGSNRTYGLNNFDSYSNNFVGKYGEGSRHKYNKKRHSKKHKKDKYYNDYYENNDRQIYESNYRKNNENNILRLFGRQTYPGSNIWEYYLTVYSGLDAIKIPFYPRRKELYTDDRVFVPELNSEYRVRLYNYDAPRYYPDLI
jgi:hypothetical protein